MAHLTFRPLARADLRNIALYINEHNPGRGTAYVDEMERSFHLYAENPDMGRARSDISDGLRSFPFGNYVVFYRPAQNGIVIVRVLHAARNIEAEM